MTAEEFQRAVDYVDQAFGALANAPGQGSAAAINASLVDGKMYELRVLSWLFEQLPPTGRSIQIVNGPFLRLKSRPGRVNRADPYLAVNYHGSPALEIWSNVEFAGIGFGNAGRPPPPLEPDYHELDIAVTIRDVPNGLLSHDAVLVAIECKDRYLDKGMLRQVLGLRRELSVMRRYKKPKSQIPLVGRGAIVSQHPPSRLFLCTSWPLPRNYEKISPAHAIHVEHVTP